LVDSTEANTVAARSSADAPEIDGMVSIEGAKNLEPGDFCEVRVTRAGEHDLWAIPV
jgi:ribosomal protein S12 methylthiotransferase